MRLLITLKDIGLPRLQRRIRYELRILIDKNLPINIAIRLSGCSNNRDFKSWNFYLKKLYIKYKFPINKENLVLDKSCGKVNVQQNMGIFRMAVPMDYPFIPIITSFNADEVIVSGIEQHQVLFPSEILIDSMIVSDINVTPLFTSSNQSTTMTGFYNLNPDPKVNPVFSQLNERGKVLAVRSEINNSSSGMLSNIIAVSDSKFISDNGSGASPENHIFLLNAIDYLMGDRELIALRSREITTRPLQELDNGSKSTWKWINMLLPSILIIAFGIFRFRNENKRSEFLEELYG